MDFIRRWLVNRDLKRGRALEGEGYYDRALAAYESGLENATEQERAGLLRGIGSCAIRTGKLSRACQALDEAVKLAPDDPDAWHLLGNVRLELRDTMGADEAFHAALKAAPDRIDILHSQAEYYAIKFPRAAFEAGKRVIGLILARPDEVERLRFPRELPLVFLRNLAAEQRFVEETAAYFDELASGGGWIRPVALNQKGILLANTGSIDGAIRTYLDVLTADPEFDAVHFNLGMSYTRKRDFDSARASFSLYAKRHPTEAVTTYGFGFIAETQPDVQAMLRIYGFLPDRVRKNPPSPPSLGRLDIARGWVQHAEMVVEHARRHLELDHDSIGPREVTDEEEDPA